MPGEERLDAVGVEERKEPRPGRIAEVVVMLVLQRIANERRVVAEDEDALPRLRRRPEVLFEPATLPFLPFEPRVHHLGVDDDEVGVVHVERSERMAPGRLEHRVVLLRDGRDRHESVGFVADVVVARHEVDRMPEVRVDACRQIDGLEVGVLDRQGMDDVPEMDDERRIDPVTEIDDELVAFHEPRVRWIRLDLLIGWPDVRVGHDDEPERRLTGFHRPLLSLRTSP